MKSFLSLILLMFVILISVSVTFSQGDPGTGGETQETPAIFKLLSIVFNVVMGAISIPILNWVKNKIPRLAEWIIPILSSIIGLAFVWLGFLTLGLTLFDNPNIYNMAITALGINLTASQIFYEMFKPKKIS